MWESWEFLLMLAVLIALGQGLGLLLCGKHLDF
jgi:hypothetical protein